MPSLPNPTTLKGWPHHRGLRPLAFSNSSVGSFTFFACGILGPVWLLPIAERPGSYLLHEESKKWLKELGYIPFGEEIDHQEDAAEVSFNDQEPEGGFL